jgi:hypothetical protein
MTLAAVVLAVMATSANAATMSSSPAAPDVGSFDIGFNSNKVG